MVLIVPSESDGCAGPIDPAPLSQLIVGIFGQSLDVAVVGIDYRMDERKASKGEARASTSRDLKGQSVGQD